MTQYHATYYAHGLSRRHSLDDSEKLTSVAFLRLPRQLPAQSQRSANLQLPQHAEGKAQPESL